MDNSSTEQMIADMLELVKNNYGEKFLSDLFENIEKDKKRNAEYISRVASAIAEQTDAINDIIKSHL